MVKAEKNDIFVSDSRRIAKNTGLLFIRMMLVLLVGLYTSRIVLHVLGFEDFGIYNVVGSVVVFFSFLKNALTNATYRYLTYELGTGDKERLIKIYSMAINCHIILAISFFILSELIGLWFINNYLVIDESRLNAANWVFQLSLVKFCINIIQTPFNSNIIAHERMNFYALISIAEVIFNLVIVYLLVISTFDKLIMYALLLCCVSVLILMCYMVYCVVKFKDCAYIRFWDKKLIGKFFSYSGWSLLVNGADVCTNQSLNIFFNQFLGVVANAALGIGNQVVGHMGMFLTNFTQAFNPQIIKSYAAKKYDYFMQLIFSTSKICFYLFCLVSFPILLNIDFVLKIWLGDYPPMTPDYVRAILLFYFFDSFQIPLWQAVHATGKLRTHQIMISSIKILVIPLAYIALKQGYSGSLVLTIWAMLNFICAVSRTIYMHKLIHLPLKKYLNEVLVKALIVFSLSFPIPYMIIYFTDEGWSQFLLSSMTSIFLICFVVYLIGLNAKEKNLLHSFLALDGIKRMWCSNK